MGEIFGEGQFLRPKFLTREIDTEILFHSTKKKKKKRERKREIHKFPVQTIFDAEYPKKKRKKKKRKRDLRIDTEFSVKKIIESVPWRAC